MSNGSAAQSPATSGVRLFPPGIYVGALILGYAIEALWPIPIVPGPMSLIVRIVGLLLLLAGASFIASATRLFRRIGTPVNPTEPTTALGVDGPYRFTRNPMYLGMALVFAGFALLGNALWPLLALIPVIWAIQTQVIAREEIYLEAKFGADYLALKSRVRRWL